MTAGHLSWSPEVLRPGPAQWLPNCSLCTGCSTLFMPMPKELTAFNYTFPTSPGASHAKVAIIYSAINRYSALACFCIATVNECVHAWYPFQMAVSVSLAVSHSI